MTCYLFRSLLDSIDELHASARDIAAEGGDPADAYRDARAAIRQRNRALEEHAACCAEALA